MKSFTRSLAFAVYKSLLRIKRSINWNRDRHCSALILPPAARPGSLGDEALVSGAIDYLKEQGVEKIGLISYKSETQWKDLGPTSQKVKIHHHFLNAPFSSQKALLNFTRAVDQYEKFYCIGADVMDGYYSEKDTVQRLEFVSVANEIGVESAVVSFSFNDQPTLQCLENFKKLSKNVRLCTRDPISHQRLQSRLDRPVNLVADLAFLLQPLKGSDLVLQISDWVNKQHSDNRFVIGINANYKLVENLKVQKTENLVEAYVKTLIELYSKRAQLSFVLIPHDFRSIKGEDSDVVLADAIWEALPSDIKTYCIKVPAPFNAAEVKGIVAQLDMVLSGRMHLAIAALSQGTPAACITYQGKFEGLFKHFELEGLLIEPQQAVQSGKLVEFLLPIIERRESIVQHIKSKLPAIKQLAMKNFKV